MFSGNVRSSRGSVVTSAAAIFSLALAIFASPFAQPAFAQTASDNFDRVDGSLGSNWASLPDGGLVISSGQATGAAAAQYTGSYRISEAYNPDQYSEVEVTSPAFSSTVQQWIGPSVRNQANGDLYVGIYWNNLPSGTPILSLFKRVAGVWTQLGPQYASGTLSPGARLKIIAAGTTISLLLDGVVKVSAFDADLSAGAPGIMAYDVPQVDNWDAGDFSPVTSATDTFDRADGSLGANWTGLPDGGLILASNQVFGAASGRVSGSMRTGELYDSNQFSQITTTALQLSGAQWIGPSVRNQADGDLYVGIYWWNNGAPLLRLYKRISGTFMQLGSDYPSGPLPPGTALKLEARGTTISFLQDGVERISVYDPSLDGGYPGITAFDTAGADNWSGGTANFEAHLLGVDPNGVESYDMSSAYDGYGPRQLRVLRPTSPASGMAHNFLLALPVMQEGNTDYGDGMETLRGLNAQNNYNVTIIAPAFSIPPWYADNPLDPNYRFESFMTLELAPWVRANLTTTGSEKMWMIGFSKSGFGALDLLFKHPDIFTLAAAWDFPADMSTYTAYAANENYGTETNFQNNYRLTSAFVSANKAPFLTDKRIWIAGYNAFQTDLSDFDALLTSLAIRHDYPAPAFMAHSWDGGWVPGALAGLSDASIALSGGSTGSAPSITSAGSITFTAGSAGSFTVTATGSPTPNLSEQGALPAGVAFTDHGNGSATLAGTPTTAGVYSFTITATNGVLPNASQNFTLTVNTAQAAPTITSGSATTFTVGSAGSFAVTATGSPAPALSEQGTLPAGVTFTDHGNGTATLAGTPGVSGAYAITIAAVNGVLPDATQNFTLTVNAAPTLSATPGSLSFAYTINGITPAAQNINVSSSSSVLNYTVSTNAAWLVATPASGATPGNVSVSVNPSGLAAGSYNGTVSITAADAGNSPQTVAVTLTVNPAPTLSLTPGTLSFAYTINGNTPAAQNVTVGSSGAALSYTVSTNAAWLTATPASGSTPGNVAVSVNPSGLAAGSYNGIVTITAADAGNSPQTVAVTLTVNPAPTLSLTPGTLSFAYTINGNTPAAQNVTVGSSGAALSYTVSTNAAWLAAAPASGTTPGNVAVSVNPSGLAAGSYNGIVTITSPQAGNSPQTVAVALAVNPAPTLNVTPAALSFTYTLTGNTPAAQNVSVSSSGAALSYTTSTSAPWLRVTPASGTTPGSVSVSVSPSTLAAGTYNGTVTITSTAAGNGPQTVAVALTVNPAPPPLAIVTTSLPNGRVGQTYSAQLQATGGFPPYSWIVVNQSSFPQGLKLSSTGLISGTPNKAGTYTFTVQATDSASHSASRNFTVTIAARR